MFMCSFGFIFRGGNVLLAEKVGVGWLVGWLILIGLFSRRQEGLSAVVAAHTVLNGIILHQHWLFQQLLLE